MSNKGIYTALSGAIAQSQRLDTIANNIANVNTPAFKRDQQVFQEYLTAHEKTPNVIEASRIPASIESFYDMNGGDKSYVDVAGTYTDFSQGSVRPTGNNLDVALEGKGFFEVQGPGGAIRYSRNGAFKIDGDGRLTTKDGFPVLMDAGGGASGDTGAAGAEGDLNSRMIRLKNANVNIASNGDIFQGGERVGRLSLVNVEPKDGVQKIGSSLYKLRENFNPQVLRDAKVEVHQGFLEGSNIEVVREMTDMIQTNRTFESTQRAIKAYDELAQKVVNVVPKLE